MAILTKACKTDNFESHNSLKLSFTNIRGLRSNSSAHMHDLAVCVKEELPFAQDLSLENSADSYLCFRLALLHSVPYFFFLYRSPS